MVCKRHVIGGLVLLCLVSPGPSAYAQSVSDPLAGIQATVPTPPLAFIAITPCRLADTRGNGFSGAFGPPSMVTQTPRVFPVAGNCGIPLSAQAVSANMAVTNTSAAGFLSVWPEGAPVPSPLVASMNYAAGQTIANAVIAPLGTNGGITVQARFGLDLIIDVNGYFDTGAAGPTGPAGADGAQGPIGPTGPPGANYSAGAGLDLAGTVFSVIYGGPGAADTTARTDGVIQNQTAAAQAASLRINGTFRVGSETGTTTAPFYSGNGMITRRIQDTTPPPNAGRVMARTDNITFERDGTNGGMRVNSTAGGKVVFCRGISSAGATVNAVLLPPAGLTTVYTDAQAIVQMDCSFGDPFSAGNLTTLSISRYSSDYYWIGFVTSTFNQ